MRKLVGLLLVVCGSISLFATEYDPAKKFVITGQYLSGNGTTQEQAESDDPTDWTKASIVVNSEVTRDDGETAVVQLALGSFEEREITLAGEIDEPTDVRITIQTSNRKLSVDALIVPGGKQVSFVLVDYNDPESDKLLLNGSSLRAKDQKKKFTIFGNREPGSEGNENEFEWVTVSADEFALDGAPHRINFATVLVEDGTYLIEAEVDEPRLAEISVYRGSERGPYQISGTYVVIEPTAIIRFERHGPEDGFFMATSDSGRHAKLVDSWRISDVYLETQHAYYAEQSRHFGQRDVHEVLKEQREAESEEEDDNVEEVAEQELTSEPSTDDGCEHVVFSEVIPGYQGHDPDAPKPQPRYTYEEFWQRVEAIERESLRDLAWNSKDPFDSLVALELGRKYWSWGEVAQTDILRLYDKLATLHDDDVVGRRIKPARDHLARTVDKLANNKRLIPGWKVPEFTLANLADEMFSLKKILTTKTMVLIDFWASWCGPCIASFPTLKELHSDYGDEGFEIISISLDDAREDWEESSAKHDLPWIDLGEMKGYFGTAAIDFGVSFLPKTYLIDAKGCILQKDISIEELKEFITTRYR